MHSTRDERPRRGSGVEHGRTRTAVCTALVTGTSSGIGRATVDAFLDAGWNVVATMRTPGIERLGEAARKVDPGRLQVAALDVTSPASIDAAVAGALERFGAIDAVVNNAGYAVVGPFEAISASQVERQFATNVLGLMAVTRSVLPHMRARGSGSIINVSSVGGRMTFPMYSVYHGTKWAVEGFSESLVHELSGVGIRVRIVEPGPIRTDFYGASMDNPLGPVPHEYEPWAGRAMQRMQASGANGAPPERVARVIVRAASSRGRRLRWPIDHVAWLLVAMRIVLPERVFSAIIRRSVS